MVLVARCGSCSAGDAATQVQEVKGNMDIKIMLTLFLKKAASVGCRHFSICLVYQDSVQASP